MKRNSLLTFTIICLSMNALLAQTAGLQFLNIGFGSRACAMGEAFVSLADDASSAYWNPGGMAMSDRGKVLFSHHGWLVKTRCDFFAGSVPLFKLGTFGISFINLSYGDIEGRDEQGYKIDDYTASDLALGLSYSRRILKNLSAGVTGKLIQSKIENEEGTGYGGDVGLLYRTPIDNLQAGVAVQHFGPGLKYIDVVTEFPTTVRGGVSYLIPISGVKIISAVDLLKEIEGDYLANMGMEVNIIDEFALRGGYKYNSPQGGLTAGLGYIHEVYFFHLHVDYAYSLYGDLGRAHRLSVGIDF